MTWNLGEVLAGWGNSCEHLKAAVVEASVRRRPEFLDPNFCIHWWISDLKGEAHWVLLIILSRAQSRVGDHFNILQNSALIEECTWYYSDSILWVGYCLEFAYIFSVRGWPIVESSSSVCKDISSSYCWVWSLYLDKFVGVSIELLLSI